MPKIINSYETKIKYTEHMKEKSLQLRDVKSLNEESANHSP